MNREEKSALIDEISQEIKESDAIFAVDYRGISVTQAAQLRGGLREADASFRVVKNRLTKLAAAKAGVEQLDEMLQGPTALTFVRGDVAQAAKAITSFNKEHEVLTYKGGLMGETVLDEGRFTAISKLPSRDRLNAQLAGVVASPLVTLTRGLGSLISGLAIQLQQVADQGLVGGTATEAPAEEPAAEESPAEEAPAEEAPAEEAPAEEPAAEEAPAEEPAAEEVSSEEASEGPESTKPSADEAAAEEVSSEEASEEPESTEPPAEAGSADESDEADEAGSADEAGATESEEDGEDAG